jgi:hypothetical protein
VVREAPFRHDRAAARDDAGHPVRRQRHIGEAHPGMDGEIVHPLLGLLDQRVAKMSQVRSSATPPTFSSA